MKETTELIDAVFNTAAQGVISFRDGFQFGDDIPDFVDELLTWPNAIQGLKLMKTEAVNATLNQVDALFGKQREKLLTAGVHPMLAGAIVANTQVIYFVYAAIAQKGEDAVSSNYAKAHEAKKNQFKPALAKKKTS